MSKDSLPQGKWLRKKTDHWLRYKKFHVFSDATGNEHIAFGSVSYRNMMLKMSMTLKVSEKTEK